MRKLLISLLAALLLLGGMTALAESKTVYLPDQSVTVRVYGTATVERTPNTVVRSFISDRTVAWTNFSGVVSGDIPGNTVATLTEYDQDTDTYYVTKVNVTVLPLDKKLDIRWDQSANSEAFRHYDLLNGSNYPVGMEFSYRHVFTYDGEELPVTYSSTNPAVASIDQNGWVTLKSAGVATLEARSDAFNTGSTCFVAVYSSNTGGGIWGAYDPEDPATVATVYAEPDTSSRVLFTFERNTQLDDGYSDLIYHVLAKEEGWCKITCQLGTGWMKTDGMDFLDGKTYESPALKEGESVSGMPSDEVYRTFAIGGTVYANDSESWIYPKPDRATEVLVRLPLNAAVTVLSQEKEWLRVRYGDTTGYITIHAVSYKQREETIREIDFPCTMYVYSVLDGMAMFAEPGRGKICEVPTAAAVTAVGISENGKYIKAEYNGFTGYIPERYLTAIRPESITIPPAGDIGSADPDVITHLIIRTGNSGKVNLRQHPLSSARVLGQYGNGTLVPVLSLEGDWARVRMLDGAEGYMMLRYLSEPPFDVVIPEGGETQPPAAELIMTVQTADGKSLNLRAEPASGATILGRFPVGTQVAVLDLLDNTWNRVSVGGLTGYMMDKFLVPATPSVPDGGETIAPSPTPQPTPMPTLKLMMVQTGNDERLNLRAEPRSGSYIWDRYENGTVVEVLDWMDDEWNLVRIGSNAGYMMDKYLVDYNAQPGQPTPTPAPGLKTMIVQTGNDQRLNLRDVPRSGAVILGRFDNGTRVTVLEESGDWAKVQVGNLTGYMMRRYLVDAQ